MAKQTITVELVDKVSRSLGTIEQRLNSLDSNAGKLTGSFGLASKAVGAFVGALAVQKIMQMRNAIIDAAGRFQVYNNQLRLITDSQGQLDATMSRLSDLARENRAEFGATVDLFQKLTLATDSMGISQERVFGVTSKFQKALAISGADANTAAGAIRQFGQAMASGTVRGDEFNSIVEALGPALNIMAQQSGLNVGKLRQLSQAGELTADVFFNMVESATALDEAFGKTTATTDQMKIALDNAFDQFLVEIDQAIGVSDRYNTILGAVTFGLENATANMKALSSEANQEIWNLHQAGEYEQALAMITNRIALLQNLGPLVDQESITFLENYRKEILEAARAAKELELEQKKANDALAAQKAALNAILAPHQKFIDAAKEYAKTDYRTELEKANQRLIDAEIALEQLYLAQERSNGQVENFVFLLKATKDEIAAAESAILNLKAATNTLAETSAFDKFYNSLITGANKSAQESMFVVQAKQRLKAELDAGKISLDTYAAAMANYTKTTKTATTTTDTLGDQIASLKDKYEKFAFTATEIARNEYAEDMAIFKQALDAKRIDLDTYNQYRLAAGKSLSEELKAIEDDITRKTKEENQKRINDYLAAGKTILSAQDQRFLKEQGASERMQRIVQDRIEFEKKSELEKTQFAIGQVGDALTALGRYNKQAFEAAKAFNIASAIMNTYAGATKALATYPPPFNFIAAAAVVASGFAQVAAIRSQQYTGRQRGGALQIGRETVVGEDGPEIIVPKQPSTVIPREVAQAIDGLGGGRGDENVIVNFSITTVDAEDFDQLLVKRRGTIVGIINQAMQKRGKRGVTS